MTKYVNENEAATKERVGVFCPIKLSTKRMYVVKNNDILKRLVWWFLSMKLEWRAVPIGRGNQSCRLMKALRWCDTLVISARKSSHTNPNSLEVIPIRVAN